MILYTKTFSLGKGMTFSRYIEILDKKNFSPYALLIERVPKTKNVHIEIVLADITALWRWGNSIISGGLLFSDATIEHSGRRDFILQASIGIGNVLAFLFYILFSAIFLLFMIFEIIAKNISIAAIFFLLLIFVLYPWISTYLREMQILDRIGSLASDRSEEAEV